MYRQGPAGVHGVNGHLGHSAGGEHQGGGLAHDAANAQDDAGEDARHGAGQDDAEHGAQLAGAQAEAASRKESGTLIKASSVVRIIRAVS